MNLRGEKEIGIYADSMPDVGRRVAHDDVEFRGEFADLGFLERGKVHDQRFAGLRILDPLQ